MNANNDIRTSKISMNSVKNTREQSIKSNVTKGTVIRVSLQNKDAQNYEVYSQQSKKSKKPSNNGPLSTKNVGNEDKLNEFKTPLQNRDTPSLNIHLVGKVQKKKKKIEKSVVVQPVQ